MNTTPENALIFHGTGADPDMHWFQWLKERLEQKDVDVAIPDFPTPENQNRENWMDVLDNQEIEIGSETILVGHSTGAVFILNVLQQLDTEIKAAFLISGFTGPLNDERYDPLNESFAEREFDFESIRSKAEYFFVYHSASDPYVPLEKAESLAVDLKANLELVADAGHFNNDSGYTEFPELWKNIQTVLNK